jgi:hypothetical protein
MQKPVAVKMFPVGRMVHFGPDNSPGAYPQGEIRSGQIGEPVRSARDLLTICAHIRPFSWIGLRAHAISPIEVQVF